MVDLRGEREGASRSDRSARAVGEPRGSYLPWWSRAAAAAAPGPSVDPPSPEDFRLLGEDLKDEMLKVTLEEFRLTEMRFETDSRLGRELLFLLSNPEWVRRTTETVDITRVAAASTTIEVDADPGYVVHEALDPDQGPLWLPLVALPPEMRSYDGRVFPEERDRRHRPLLNRRPLLPDLPVNIQVTDASGQRVAELPQAEVRRQLAAALAETLVARINHRAEENGDRGGPGGVAGVGVVLGREHQVLMAAAIAQVIAVIPGRDTSGRLPKSEWAKVVEASRSNRLEHLQRVLFDALTDEIDHIRADDRRHPMWLPSALLSREAQIVHAVRGIMIVVVPVSPTEPATFTVTMPSRRLGRRHHLYGHRSMADLRIALLVPGVHADRVINVLVPDGVQVPARRSGTLRVDAQITVAAPQQFEQLCQLADRLIGTGDGVAGDGEDSRWVRKQLAELTVVKLDAVIQALRHHYDVLSGTRDTGALVDALWRIRDPFDDLARADENDEQPPPEALRQQWAELRPRIARLRYLRRRLERNTASPGSVRFLAPAVDEFTLRADPIEAHVDIAVAPSDPPVLDTAAVVNLLNLLLLTGITVGLWLQRDGGDPSTRAQVLSALLAIFPTIQAARVTRPDPGLLNGLLQVPHFWLGLWTAVPGVVLAATLAFTESGLGAVFAGVICVLLQFAVQVRIWRHQFPPWYRWDPGIHLFTEHAPDHVGLNAVRTAWCRSLTNEALLLGRTAFPFVVVDDEHSDGLLALLSEAQGGRPRLSPSVARLEREGHRGYRRDVPEPAGTEATPSVNLLALFMATTTQQSAMFLVFRDEPPGLEQSGGPDGTRIVQRVPLTRGRLVPLEPPTWVLDVMVGIERRVADILTVGTNPLSAVSDATRSAGFSILNVRLPAPPPPQDTENRIWLRLRVGVPHRPGESLDRLAAFLQVVGALKEQDGVVVHLREVPQMPTLDATQTAPEDSFDELPGQPGLLAATSRLVMDTQVDIVSNGDRGVEWRLLPVCAPARVGLMSRLFSALEEHDPELVIAAAVSGVFNGISVIFLLCRAPADATGSARAMAGHVAERLEASDHAVVPTTKARRHVRIAAPHRPRALLKVQLRTPDRPGAVQHLLIELRARLCEAVADNSLEALDVLYALTPVVDGHALSGRLLLGLPHHPSGAEKEWENLQWQEIGAHRLPRPRRRRLRPRRRDARDAVQHELRPHDAAERRHRRHARPGPHRGADERAHRPDHGRPGLGPVLVSCRRSPRGSCPGRRSGARRSTPPAARCGRRAVPPRG
jgi:hypothetical protein